MKRLCRIFLMVLPGLFGHAFAAPVQTNLSSFVHQVTLTRDSVRTRLSEWVSPVEVQLPFAGGALTVQSAAMYARQTGQTREATWGALDTRITGEWALGNRAMLSLHGAIPTGKQSLDSTDVTLVQTFSRNDLGFPVKTFSQGPEAGGALSLAHQGGHWSLSLGGGYTYKGAYDPFAGIVNYKPGDEISGSFGFDYSYEHFVYRVSAVGTYFLTDRQDGLVVFRNGKQILLQAGVLYTGEHLQVKAELTNIARMKNKDLSNGKFLYETRDSNGDDLRAAFEASWTPRSAITLFGIGNFKYLTPNAYAPGTPLYQGKAHLAEGGGGLAVSWGRACHLVLRGTRLSGKTEDNAVVLTAFNVRCALSLLF